MSMPFQVAALRLAAVRFKWTFPEQRVISPQRRHGSKRPPTREGAA